MSRVLIPYGTTEGQTARIAEVIAEALRERGPSGRPGRRQAPGRHHPGRLRCRGHRGLDPQGKHDKHVVDFVQKNLDALARLHSAFFSVSLVAHGDTQEAER
jgi:menaquinone-dependent protoporphyrinogen oxidase